MFDPLFWIAKRQRCRVPYEFVSSNLLIILHRNLRVTTARLLERLAEGSQARDYAEPLTQPYRACWTKGAYEGLSRLIGKQEKGISSNAESFRPSYSKLTVASFKHKSIQLIAT